MIAFIYNHNVFDDPYNQTAVKKGFAKLDACTDSLQVKPFYSFGAERSGLFSPDMSDEYVIVKHSLSLAAEQKKCLAECIKETLTVKKTVYKEECPEILIVFEKINQDDCFVFNV